VDVLVRAKFFGERSFVGTAADSDSLKSHAAGILNAEVAESADALNGNSISCAGVGVSERVENSNSGTEQRSSFWRGKICRDGGDGFGGRNHIFGVAAIEVDGGDLLVFTVDEIATAASIANEAVSTVPTDPDALARLP